MVNTIRHRNQKEAAHSISLLETRSSSSEHPAQQQKLQSSTSSSPSRAAVLSAGGRPLTAAKKKAKSSSCCCSCNLVFFWKATVILIIVVVRWNLVFLKGWYYHDSLGLQHGNNTTASSSSPMDQAAVAAASFHLQKQRYRAKHPTTTANDASENHDMKLEESSSHKSNDMNDKDDHRKVPKRRRQPTHQACEKYDGIYHVAMSDELGGVGTAFFQLVIGQILYAERYNLKPWIHFNNFSKVFYDADIHDGDDEGVRFRAMGGRNVTYQRLAGKRRPPLPNSDSSNNKKYPYYRYWRRDQTPGPPSSTDAASQQHPTLRRQQQQDFHFTGTGVWEHYFEPVSDFVPGDTSCESKLYVTMDLYLITPGIHGFSDDYATRCWRYDYLPAYITQPHIPLTQWLEPQRRRAHDVIQRYNIQPRRYLQQAAHQANPQCGFGIHHQRRTCLGLHIRHSDKAAGRRVLAVSEFLPYAQAFVHAGGEQIYVATDSTAVLDEIESTWPVQVRERIRTLGGTGDEIIRSQNTTAVFDMASHHTTNIQALTEIYALSQCQYLVHGLSAVSEASIWINFDVLHNRSVNLEEEETHRLTVAEFGTLVAQDRMLFDGQQEEQESGEVVSSIYRPKSTRTFAWWDQLKKTTASAAISSVTTACAQNSGAADEYNGILLISAVAPGAGVGHAFFTSVLNQLLYAERYKLQPWIYLQPDLSLLVYDAAVHNRTNSTMLAFVGQVEDEENSVAAIDGVARTRSTPGKPIMMASRSTASSELVLAGNGIWETYFEPVSAVGSSRWCQNDEPPHIVALSQRQVSSGLESFSPWAIRAWRYDTVPEDVWNPEESTLSMNDRLQTMRQKAHNVVKKYFRFRPAIVKRADEVNPVEEGEPCMAVHLRAAAKDGKYRKTITAESYLPYMESFVRAGGKVIYVASDSSRALRFMLNTENLSPSVTRIVRTQGNMVARSPVKDLPTHLMDEHHRVNSETLVDILAMAKCQLLLHSYSAVAEAAIYFNPNLHNNSVNMEDGGKISSKEFEFMSRNVIDQSKPQTNPEVPSRLTFRATSGEDARILQYQRANTTVLSRSKDRACRSNAIVYLAQKRHSTYGRDSYSSLLRSLDLLHENYLSIDDHINNTSIFIFHTNDFNETDIDVFESRLGPSYRHMIHLIDLSGSSYWGRPQNLAESNPESWYAYPLFSEGYRHMMRFFAMEIWNFFAEWNNATGCSYRYIFRMDEDSFLHSPIRYDIFDFMRSNEYVYGYRMCTYEMEVANRMWTRWQQQRADWKPKRELALTGCGFYNNFFVADLEFFLRQDVQEFLRFIARRGHIYKWRLGDLVIHTMAILGYAETNQVHRFLDFTYEHGTINQTSGCLVWGGIQAGYNDPNARETLDMYYRSMLLERNCSVNSTFLQEPDLSPSYIHHLPFTQERGGLALHTIAAGGVELSGKGLLSG